MRSWDVWKESLYTINEREIELQLSTMLKFKYYETPGIVKEIQKNLWY